MTDAEYDYSDALAQEIADAFSDLSIEDVLGDDCTAACALECEYARRLGY